MVMTDSFDPTLYASASECVKALADENIKIGHRLGARIFGLGRRGIRFSYAFLDEAAEGGPAAECLKKGEWNKAEATDPEYVRSILGGAARLSVSDGICYVITADEDTDEDGNGSNLPVRGSVLPAVLGKSASDTDLSRAFSGLLWDRKRMEESALILLDGEDEQKLIEAFRYLFRAALACAQDPTALLVTALRRGKAKLSREAAVLVRDNLDREFGRVLGDLLRDDSAAISEAIRFFESESGKKYIPVLQAVLLPALTPLVEKGEFRSSLLPGLPRLASIIRECTDPDIKGRELEAFLDRLLGVLPEMELVERLSVSLFIVEVSPGCPHLSEYLLRRLRVSEGPDWMAFLGNILSRIKLSPEQHLETVKHISRLFVEHGQASGLRRRLWAIVRGLGHEALEELAKPENIEKMDQEQRILLLSIWHDFRHEKTVLPDEKLFTDLVVRLLANGDKGALLALVRTHQLDTPELNARLIADFPEKPVILSFLVDSVWHLEEPDDEAVLGVLSKLGMDIVRHNFSLVCEEAALESGEAAMRMHIFGKLIRRIKTTPEEIAEINGMIEKLLSYENLDKSKLPVIWLAWGELGAVDGIDQALEEKICSRIAENLAKFPEARAEALLIMYPHAAREVKIHIEHILRSVFNNEAPDRKVLEACLHGLVHLLEDGPMLIEADALVSDLCRTVLSKTEDSLDDILAYVLADNAEGDGVRIPTAWNRNDRERALRIMGAIAVHEETPDRLRRAVIYRLFSFLTDWLEGIEKGQNLYAYRDTPLWEILGRIVEKRPECEELAIEACVRVLEDHNKRLPGLDLDKHENAQKFLLAVIRFGEKQMVISGAEIDLRRAVVRTLIDIAKNSENENNVTEYLLEKLIDSGILPITLAAELTVALAQIKNK